MRIFLYILLMIILLVVSGYSAVHQLTIDSGDNENPCWSPDGTKIVFESNRSGPYNIWVMNADGTNQHNISNSIYNDRIPVYSHDGSKIAFCSDRDSDSDYSDIYVMPANGGTATRVTTSGDYELFPTWSPDGAYIIYAAAPNMAEYMHIWKISSNGGTATQLTFGAYNESEPEWSSNGSKIAFDGSGQYPSTSPLCTMTPEGQNIFILVSEYAYSPGWSPDSTKVAFTSGADVYYNIYTVPAVGGTPTQITYFTEYDCWAASWSPDSTKIAFQRRYAMYASNIWYIDTITNPAPSTIGHIKATYR